MSRYTNEDIKLTLSALRSDVRNGRTIVANGQLRNVVAQAFGFDVDAFNTENFNPQTFRRFAKLFAIPQGVSQDSGTVRWPSQDEYAWALQNFINRRGNPWAHVTQPEVPAPSATATA